MHKGPGKAGPLEHTGGKHSGALVPLLPEVQPSQQEGGPLYGGVPPYKETQNYVKTVTSYMNGSPISTGKVVSKSQSGANANTASTVSSLLSSGLSSAGGVYGSSSSYGQSTGMYGLLTGGVGSYYGSGSGALSALLGSASMDESGETITLDKESFISLVEIMRLQMMMNASREAGSLTL